MYPLSVGQFLMIYQHFAVLGIFSGLNGWFFTLQVGLQFYSQGVV